jgi:hypothetical protein
MVIVDTVYSFQIYWLPNGHLNVNKLLMKEKIQMSEQD